MQRCLQELAVDVLRLRLGDPAWTAQLAPYWASLPPQGSLFSKEAWSADHLDILQDHGLARSFSAAWFSLGISCGVLLKVPPRDGCCATANCISDSGVALPLARQPATLDTVHMRHSGMRFAVQQVLVTVPLLYFAYNLHALHTGGVCNAQHRLYGRNGLPGAKGAPAGLPRR